MNLPSPNWQRCHEIEFSRGKIISVSVRVEKWSVMELGRSLAMLPGRECRRKDHSGAATNSMVPYNDSMVTPAIIWDVDGTLVDTAEQHFARQH